VTLVTRDAVLHVVPAFVELDAKTSSDGTVLPWAQLPIGRVTS
jgi:hypothetical protein